MDFGSLEDQFNCLSMKFIFVVEDGTGLNDLLNELNGLDFKNHQISAPSIVQFIQSLPKIPISSDPNVIVKVCHLIKQLMSKQKISLPENVSNKIIFWILRCCETKSVNVFYSEAVDVLTALFKTNQIAALKVKLQDSKGTSGSFVSLCSIHRSCFHQMDFY